MEASAAAASSPAARQVPQVRSASLVGAAAGRVETLGREQRPSVARDAALAGRGRDRVLLVDAAGDSLHALAGALRGVGYRVVTARDGVEGLSLASRWPPGLVVADLWPFFSGTLQMIERLRALPATRCVPLVVIAPTAPPDYRRRALAAGCEAILERPCGEETLLDTVGQVLDVSLFAPPERAFGAFVS